MQVDVFQHGGSFLVLLERTEVIARFSLVDRSICEGAERELPNQPKRKADEELVLQHLLDGAHEHHSRLRVKERAIHHLHARKGRGRNAILALLGGKHFILLYASHSPTALY